MRMHEDQDMAIAAIHRIRERFAHPTLDDVVVPDSEVMPGKAVQDEQLLAYIKASGRTMSHASSTCRVGKKEDEMAVVDSEGRVFGTSRLRVVDLSAVPFLPQRHPMATVYALAEKVSETVLGEMKR